MNWELFMLGGLIVLQMVPLHFLDDKRRKYAHILVASHERQRLEWASERKELLDRIQASSFAEYKGQEIRLVKAQQPAEKVSTIEQV